jgi:cation transport regulator ChaB
MKKYAKKKYITGGYTPVGIIPPSIIKENKESNDTFGSQLGKAGNFMLSKALPVASMALGIPGIGSALPTGIGAAVNSFQAKRKENNDSTSSPLISLVRELADSAKMNYGGQLPNGAVKIKGAKDQKLNDSATLIKGNPNKTDGNQYLVNGQRIHLDNNEVVKGNMVVSDSVINPATGNSFAKDVTDIERQIGKASKDTSLEGRNTLKHLSNRTKSLIQQQEMITGRSDGTHFQKGGPIDPKLEFLGRTPNNVMKLGNIEFDTDKSRPGKKGELIVTDTKTGKDFGVKRMPDGSYDWFRDNPSKYPSNGGQDQDLSDISDRFIPVKELSKTGYGARLTEYDGREDQVVYDPASKKILFKGDNLLGMGHNYTDISRDVPLSQNAATNLPDSDRLDKITAKYDSIYGSRYHESPNMRNGKPVYGNRYGYDKGGPLPKGLNVKDFQEWAIKNGATIKADGAWGPQTEALYTQYKDAYGLKDHAYDYNELADLTDRMGTKESSYGNVNDNAERYDRQVWSQPLPASGTNIANQSTLPDLSKYRIQPETEGANITMSKLGALPDLFNVDGASETPPGIVTNPIVTPEEQKKQEAAARFKALGAKSGDALQAASVVSQMFRAHQKPKLEKRYNVNAPITQESFDVTNPLQQSNRVFKNMVSGIDAGSVNTKRAVANSMYANRLSNDSNTIQQYDVMNQGARSNYEQKLAQRQAQNVQLSQYTDDLDQRNLGAYNNAKDVAWSSVNNFGKAINDKKSAYANLEMLKKIYSDVAKNIK